MVSPAARPADMFDTLGLYVLRRAGGRFVLLLALFIGIIVGGNLGALVARGVPPEELIGVVHTMVLAALPISLPLAMATAVLLAIGTMNRDGELRALASCGISQVAVVARLGPLIAVGVAIAAALWHVVMPLA